MASTPDDSLLSRDGVKIAMSTLTSDKEQYRKTMQIMNDDRAVSRYAERMKRDPRVRRNVMAGSRSDMVSLVHMSQNAGNTRQTSGIKCVMLSGKKKKQTFYPNEIGDWERELINDKIGVLYTDMGGKPNKLAESITGKKYNGDVYIFHHENGKQIDTLVTDI